MLKKADVHVRHVILLEYKLNIFFLQTRMTVTCLLSLELTWLNIMKKIKLDDFLS